MASDPTSMKLVENPLFELIGELRQRLESDRFGEINMHFRSIYMTFLFLGEIWQRILDDVELDQRYWTIYADLYQPGAPEREPTKEELRVLQEWGKHYCRLNLDIEDFFIHGNILMDKMAKFAAALLRLLVSNQEDSRMVSRVTQRSFDHHRKFFTNLKNIPFRFDEDYGRYIRENTGWYQTQLMNPRDDLVVHEHVPRFWGYSLSNKEIEVSRFRHDRSRVEKLYQLRNRYSTKFPEVVNEKNFLDLLDFFEKNISSLEESDKDVIRGIRQYCGGSFPDIPAVYKRICDHMAFLNNHFLEKAKAILKFQPNRVPRSLGTMRLRG